MSLHDVIGTTALYFKNIFVPMFLLISGRQILVMI